MTRQKWCIVQHFELYKRISNEMDEKLVGIKTINGTIIKGKSYHSIARVIGSVDNVLNL